MRVLSITHGANVPGGVFEEAVSAAGHELERWSAPEGRPPRRAESYDAVLVFGGSMHPDQDESFGWLGREEAFLRSVLDGEVPALGVCLGAQMLARAAGARVGPAPSPEIGWLHVELTPAGRDDPVLGRLPARTTAFQWHSYTFEVPARAVELARSPVCPQAFRLRSAWAIQFHAEVTLPMLETWVAEDEDELPMPGEQLLAETRRRIARWNEHGRAVASAFLDVASRGGLHSEGATSSTTSFAAEA